MEKEFNLISVLKKRIKLIAIVFIVILGLGIAYSLTRTPLYLSSISATTFIVENFKVKQHIEYLVIQIENDDYEGLAESLNVDESVAENLIDVSLVPEFNNLYQYEIEIAVIDPETVGPLFDGIIYYLNSVEYNSRRIESEGAKLESIISNAEEELKQIESAKSEILEKDQLITYPSNIHKESVEINEILENARQSLELLSVIEVIRPYYIPKDPFSPNIPLLIAISFFGGLFVAVSLAVVIELFQRV